MLSDTDASLLDVLHTLRTCVLRPQLPEGFDSMEQYLRFLCHGSRDQPLDRGTATKEPHMASKTRSVVERVKRAKAARASSPLMPAAPPVYTRFAQPVVEIPPGLPRMRPFHPSAAPLKHAGPAELRAQAEGYEAEIRCGKGSRGWCVCSAPSAEGGAP